MEDHEIPGVMDDHDIPGVTPGVIPGVHQDNKAEAVTSDEITGAPEEDNPGIYGEESEEELQSTSESVDRNNDDEGNGDGDAGNVDTPDEETCHPDTMTPSIQRIHGLRPKKPRDYIHMHANIVHHAAP
jgi:hypothetical protein